MFLSYVLQKHSISCKDRESQKAIVGDKNKCLKFKLGPSEHQGT